LSSGGWFYRKELSEWLGKKPFAAPTETTAEGRHAGHTMPIEAKSGERKILYWYDPMHPKYRSDKPGIAPDCGMQLVPKYAYEETAMKEMPAGTVQITAQKQQLIGVRTGQVERQHVERTLRAVGRVTIDETRVAHIHTKVVGYIEEVFADFVGKEVKAGDPLFTIYSPDLVATQEEFLLALRSQKTLKEVPYKEVSSGATSLVEAARERLRLWDMSEEAIAKLESDGKAKRTVTIYSPASGIITDRAAYHHGRYVNPEMDLYTVTDLSTVWVLAEVFEYEVPYVRVGQDAVVRLSYYPEKTYRGEVSFINPAVDPKTRTIKVRVELPNPNFELKPDMFADVELAINFGTHVVVPQEAVLDSGTQQVVFVAVKDGHFEPRPVKLGPRLPGLPKDLGAGEQVIVLSGLRPGETIVTSGNFLIDSESRLKTGMGAMQH
jgi:RND family efflux transporter MFP subunit